METQPILTVGELTARIRGLLETHFSFVGVVGEISNLRRPASGHYYFTLKDQKAQLKGVLFRMQQRYLQELPRDGMEVLCRGRISVYEPRGDYQLIVDTMEPRGAGELRIAFERLKQQLEEEGLFATSLKKKLPLLPDHITVVTSPQGAAVHDFIRVARKRCPAVSIGVFPVSVQGPESVDQIVTALTQINRHQATDIIVLCRGGGSLEDLWSFNDEKTIRAIHASEIPVVSAVGHEVDHTLADLAADLRAPTPSAAAELLVPEAGILQRRLEEIRQRLATLLISRIRGYHESIAMQHRILGKMQQPLAHFLLRLDYAATGLETGMRAKLASAGRQMEAQEVRIRTANPLTVLHRDHRQVENLSHRLARAIKTSLADRWSSFRRATALLEAVSPLSTLARGYAVVRGPLPNKGIITDEAQVRPGDQVEVTLHQGRLLCEVCARHGDEQKIKNHTSQE